MRKIKTCRKIILLIFLLAGGQWLQAQTAWFADGYHGGVYGHYPMWQVRFMLDKLKDNPGWKINLELEPETWDSVEANDHVNYQLFQKYYESTGRFGRIEFVNPAYAQPYCYNISGESIIRQFSYGMAKIREHFPNASFLTYAVEEPCFTSSLPQILKGFGYQYAVLRNPNTCWGGYTSSFGKDLVRWIGPDGTVMLAVPRYACEKLSTQSTWQTDSWTNSNAFIATCFAAGIKYPVGMTFQDAGWKGGPWNNQYSPTLYTTWTEYIDRIKDKVEPADWKFTQEDVKPGLVWGAQVLQKLAQQVRKSENQLIIAEKMACFDFLLTGEPWPCSDFVEAWRTLMLAQHHDCWIVPYNGKPGATWADKVTQWTNSSNQIAARKINHLFKTDIAQNDQYIQVFNTLAWTRTDLVKIALQENTPSSDFEVYNALGKIVPSQLSVNVDGKSVLCFNAAVPSMGFSTFELKKAKKQALTKSFNKLANGTLKIETSYYSVIIDPKKGCTITSLIDKKHGNRQLVKEGCRLNKLCGYFYQKGKFKQGSDSPAKVTVAESGQLYTKMKVENQIDGSPYTQWITFFEHNPRIDFELMIDWKGQPGIGEYDQSNNYKAEDRKKAFYNDYYKLHLQFPLKDLGDNLFKNAPFDVCESQLENTLYSSWDSIKHNVILNWVDVENAAKDYGVTLFSDHTTSYLHTEKLPLGLTVQYTGKGLWGRNYRIDGPTHLKYALIPHSDNWEQSQIEAANCAWNEPLIGHFAKAEKGPNEWSLFEIQDKNLQASSVTMEGKDLMVRFYNTSSENKLQEVCWNCTAENIQQVDLSGKMISPVKVEKTREGKIITKLSIPQFGFQTLKLTNAKLK
jgi:alpha-mannosidase